MRKLKLQVQTSIDGFVAGADGGMDWLTFEWSDDLKDYVTALTEPVDTILLGRKLAEGFIPYWTASFNSPEPQEGAEKFATTPKVVFTKTLTQSEWANTVLAQGALADEVNALKNQDGGDLIVYGGGSFVSSLLEAGLIDELHLFVNPAVIGAGMPIFQAVTAKQQYQLLNAQRFDCGIALLCYSK